MLTITKENYQTEVLDSKIPVILDVFAVWCGPCQHMKPIFEALEKEMGDSYKFATLNVEDDRALSVELGVSSIPSFFFFKEGKLIAKELGLMNLQTMKQKILSHLG